MLLLLISGAASAQESFDGPPIDYFEAPVDDPVARLQRRLDSGEARLAFDGERGYLGSILRELGVPVSSQALVFSKTSFQLRRISPRTPRAVYFGDDVYVGWVRGGDVLEVSAVDPRQGAIFYTLAQEEGAPPRFERRTHECLQCHDSRLTKGVPGHLVRSVYPAPDGQPILRAGTHLTDHTSPLEERWGGWYVTGSHGSERHLGNVTMTGDDPAALDRDAGANVTSLEGRVSLESYLSPHSDIVALLVLEHQTQAHNLITRAGYVTRVALHDQKVLNELLEEPPDHLSESTRRRIESVAESLVRYLLFVGEAPLEEPVRGTSAFTEEFAARGVRDRKGRSLRDLDLETRLFRHPLSYLVYSEAFAALPPAAAEVIYRRLREVLTGEDTSRDFRHLTPERRRAILEILRDTKASLPESWEIPGSPEGGEANGEGSGDENGAAEGETRRRATL